jgi:hypothetical protein
MNDNGKCELCCRESMVDCRRCGGVDTSTFDYLRHLLGHVRCGLSEDDFSDRGYALARDSNTASEK